jgi:hypothetical protein
MFFGMTILTFVHMVLSLIDIFARFVVVFGRFASKRLDAWAAVFLAGTI